MMNNFVMQAFTHLVLGHQRAGNNPCSTGPKCCMGECFITLLMGHNDYYLLSRGRVIKLSVGKAS